MIAEEFGIDAARGMLMKYGQQPSDRKKQQIKNDGLLNGYDLMPGEQSKCGYAKEIAKQLGIDADSALTHLKRLIKRREKRDGNLHKGMRAELEEMRNELQKRATKKPKKRQPNRG